MKEKKLNPLDKIMIEGKIDDFKRDEVTLQELNDFMNWYEQRQFDTFKYREEIKDLVEKKLYDRT